jgi:lipoyl(octanoyl) transferase
VLDVEIVGIGENTVDYLDAWTLQKTVHSEVVAKSRPDTLLLLEHTSVYTAGKRTEDDERPTDGTPVIDVDRGGKITWHGPGQLVGYPITRLAVPVDVVKYVRMLEDLLIDVLAKFDILGERVDGRSGVWVKRGLTHDKIAAIGIRVSEGVTMHGFSLNVNNSLEAYRGIIACGIRDAGVTTMNLVTGKNITVDDVLPHVVSVFTKHFEDSYANA